jgi:hypothetical protein
VIRVAGKIAATIVGTVVFVLGVILKGVGIPEPGGPVAPGFDRSKRNDEYRP